MKKKLYNKKNQITTGNSSNGDFDEVSMRQLSYNPRKNSVMD